MIKITKNDFKVPNTCGECNFIGYYENYPFNRNPHCCCELIYDLKKEDYKVDKNTLDENCPLKTINDYIEKDPHTSKGVNKHE